MAETESAPRVGLVIVSHSSLIAAGVVDVAAQMAPDVAVVAAGGTDDGLGTDLQRIARALTAADQGSGTVILCDLGSAIMTSESAIELLSDERRSRTVIADGPLVEGAVAAAVASQIGGDRGLVRAAAENAGGGSRSHRPGGSGQSGRSGESDGAVDRGRYARTVMLVNADGLHARPAAEFVKLAGKFETRITVNGTDAKSLLGIMSLGLHRGTALEIAGDGTAAEAVDALAELVESGFGE